jgi:hypothetical protein
MTKHVLLGFALLTSACTDFDPGQAPAEEAATDQALAINETETGVAGSFGDMTFTSEMATDKVLEITIKVNGMMITALVDYTSGVLETDGYAADTGENTQMTEEDRVSLTALEHALAKLGDDEGLPFTLQKLRGFVATWSEHPTTVDMQTMRVSAENRSWTSLCYAKNTYYPASHDCDAAGFWTDKTTLDNVYMSSTGDLGGPDGVAWYFPSGGGFQCCSTAWYGACSTYTCNVPSAGWYSGIEVAHDTRVEHSYGNCFGACGGGCPGTYQYTVDCVNHDQCVRNGHVVASGYCDDQYASASDDWMSAPDCGR